MLIYISTLTKNFDFHLETYTVYNGFSSTSSHPNTQVFPLQIIRISVRCKQTYFKMASVSLLQKLARILKIGGGGVVAIYSDS